MKTVGITTQTRLQPRGALRWEALCGASGRWAAVLFLGMIVLVGAIQPGYDPLADPISHLGAREAPYAGWFNTVMALTGALIAMFALGLHRALAPAAFGWWPPLLIGSFGLLGVAGSGFFTCDVGCNGASVAGQLHYVPAVLGGSAMIWGMALLPARLRESPGWEQTALQSQFAAVLCFLGILVFDLSSSGAMTRWHPYVGLTQKAIFAVMFVWMYWMGGKLKKIPDR